tara:strand:+ start:6760 stop:7200 length:441 start_codon:yes stop_codon:yes gene_type:complete
MPLFSYPPDGALDVLSRAANVIMDSTGDVVYLYGSAGRYYNRIEDPGTRTVGPKRQIMQGRKFSATSDFDVGIQSTTPQETLDTLNQLIADGLIPRFIPRTEMPRGDIRSIQNRGYWPSGHTVSYIIHTGELHGRAQDRYVFDEDP